MVTGNGSGKGNVTTIYARPEISIQGQYYSGYRAMIGLGQVAWSWDLHASCRPRLSPEALEDGSLSVEEVE